MSQEDLVLQKQELRKAFERSVQDFIEWTGKHLEWEGDQFCAAAVHFLRSGDLVAGFPGHDDFEYERVMHFWNGPQGWVHTYEGDTLWEVYVGDFREPEKNETTLMQALERAMDAFRGGESLSEQRERQRNRNIRRAMHWAHYDVRKMPEHLRPIAQRMFHLYHNGNVVLTFTPSENADDQLKREFRREYANFERVFGPHGDRHIGEVNVGVPPDNRWDWDNVTDLVTKAMAVGH